MATTEVVEIVRVNSIDSIVVWLKWFHGQWPALGTLFVLIGIDVVTGILAAKVSKNVSSSIGMNGMIRKVMIILLVSMCMAIEPFCQGMPVSQLAATGFIVVEVMSILENCVRAKVPIPAAITDALAILHKDKRQTTDQVSTVQINKAEHVEFNPSHDKSEPSRVKIEVPVAPEVP